MGLNYIRISKLSTSKLGGGGAGGGFQSFGQCPKFGGVFLKASLSKVSKKTLASNIGSLNIARLNS